MTPLTAIPPGWRPEPDATLAVLRDRRGRDWRCYQHPAAILETFNPGDVPALLQTVETQARRDRLHAVGFVAYEAAAGFDAALCTAPPAAGEPLAWFGLFPEPRRLPDAVVRAAARPHAALWTPDQSAAQYRAALRQVRAHIRRGDTYQVNYTFRLLAPHPADPWGLFAHLVWAQAARFGAFLQTADRTLCSAAPELFFHRRGRRLEMRPMKGTMPRGRSRAEDLRRAAALRRSTKNQAENIMIVDMVRNDLGRIAAVGSIRVPRRFTVESYPNVWQMTSTVRGTTDAGLADIFKALFPCASITGAPKAATMRIIRNLETSPRGVYTGAIGTCTPDGEACFNVAIRTVQIEHRAQTARYGVGGGIVWDSRAGAEFEECRRKASILSDEVADFELLETFRWTPQTGLFLARRHLARLRASAAYFNFRIHWPDLWRRLREAQRTLPPVPHRIRLRVPDGAPPRIETGPLLADPRPVRVRLAASPIDDGNRFLYHKTTHRQVYDTARSAVPDADDVLLWNPRGHLTESCIANLAVRIGDEWHTPPLRCGLLPGTYRAELLQRGRMRETLLTCQDLQRAEGLALINSVRLARAAVLPSGGPRTDPRHLAELNPF